MLSNQWTELKNNYDFVIIGSGYGGAITAARIAAEFGKTKSVCILERGREWPIGEFPDRLDKVMAGMRSDFNPLGLYEFLNYQDISVLKGCGLGGTSLINANVAIIPDSGVFELANWPASLTHDSLLPYYERARAVLDASPHPHAAELGKVQALDERARQMGTHALPLNIAVNFRIEGPNQYGIDQQKCKDCGDCITGCNFGAKNTLYMNYLPMASNSGAQIFTQAKVKWIEKNGGGWQIHGEHRGDDGLSDFTLLAANVIVAAGSINSTEILLRSEAHGLSVSPALGTRFSGNGDFFGLAYNSDFLTNVMGYGRRTAEPGGAAPPGPTIVGAVRYNGVLPIGKRILVEDLSFPTAYVLAAKSVFPLLGGENTVVGEEDQERARIRLDRNIFDLYNPGGALNHTMMYLVMGQDDAGGTMVFDPDADGGEGSMKIEWQDAGRQIIFTRINEELRRHTRALRGSFISNPLWNIFNTRHLITAHPIGGCPIGEDYLHGAVDEYGRVFAGDGSVHQGLFVADGSLLPSALGVNPFLTISALSERIAERKVREMKGEAYPQPKTVVSLSVIDSLEVVTRTEAGLENLFRRCQTQSIDVMINRGGGPQIDISQRTITNDNYWKGFFPKGHILNAMSSALFAGFKKEFRKEGDRYTGITSDTDGRITARNSLEEIHFDKPTGTLEAGKYILLRYLDIPWTGYYDVFKVINENLLIGRVYLGDFPNGVRLFTFPMTRRHAFSQMTVDEHRTLYQQGARPSAAELSGIWQMDVISNANHTGSVAYLKFDLMPDGRLESRYQLMGLMEGLLVPSFTQDHFQLHDFTPFHDEIRKIDDNFFAGKYVTGLPPGLATAIGNPSLGIFHTEPAPDNSLQFGFYYTLTRADQKQLPTNTLLRPFLDVQLPDGLGMTFDEEMVGRYYEGATTPAPGREGDLTILNARPEAGVACSFKVRMTVKDLNEFIDGYEHEATTKGTITLDNFQGQGHAVFTVDEQKSLFNYLRVNPVTQEAEMRYHLEFRSDSGRQFFLDGRKYMQKEGSRGLRGMQQVLEDYTTLYCHFGERSGDKVNHLGTGLLKFRTFEDLAAVRNLADFLRSFQITGTDDPILQMQAQLRFLAFTGQFVQTEYDPLSPDTGNFSGNVRAEVLRGADTPDFFSTRPTSELQAILRDTPTQPIEKLINTGTVRVDFAQKRIFRDSFWKGSFAKESLVGWEERVRNTALGGGAEKSGAAFAGGSFWKRFDRVEGGVATGNVVNYEMTLLPGDPVVKQISYPDNNRRYFKQGDPVLLLNYRNDPYKLVYDTIKIIDDNNAIGVMHLGDFPNGIEFAAFVMARHNYPFEKMSIADHNLIFRDPHTSVPNAAQLEGTWAGNLVFVTNPDTTLLNQINPVAFQLSFHNTGAGWEGHYRLGPASGDVNVNITAEFVELIDGTSFHDEIRSIDNDTLIGKWASPQINPALLEGLSSYVEPRGDRFVVYYVLTRVKP